MSAMVSLMLVVCLLSQVENINPRKYASSVPSERDKYSVRRFATHEDDTAKLTVDGDDVGRFATKDDRLLRFESTVDDVERFISNAEGYMMSNPGGVDRKLTANDEGTKLTANIERTRLTANDEGTKLTANNEKTKLTANDEGTKLTANIERTRLTANDERTKLTVNKKTKITANDEGTKLTVNIEKTKLTANDEGTKLTANIERPKLTSNDEGITLTANNERKKLTANDEEKKKLTAKDDSRKITDKEYSIKKFSHNSNESLSKSASDEITTNAFKPKEETVMRVPPILDEEKNKTNEERRRRLAEAGKPRGQNKQFLSKNITTELLTRSATIVTMLWQILEDKVTGCQFVLVTTNIWQPIISYIISFTSFEPLVLMDISKRGDLNSSNIPKGIWGGPNTVCRVAIIDLMQDDVNYVLNFLEASKFYLWPNSLPVIIGEDSKAQQTLNHRLFRNFHHPIYFGLQSPTIKNILNNGTSDEARKEEILVYSRCLYCGDGAPERIFIFLWPIGSKMPRPINSLRDRLLDLEGHKFRVLSMPTFPYCAYRRDSDKPGSTLTLLDSVDKRLLEAVSTHLNFTYDIRVPMDGQWGVSTKTGNWTGMVGELQHEQADFTTTVAPTLGRLDVMDTTKAYTADVLAIVCLKPQLFPQYLVLIKPFTADVWAYIMITIMVWAVSFWAIQRIWSWYNDEKCMSLVESFFSWAIVLDDVHLNPPSNTPSRVTLLFWLLGTFVITTGYRSSLVAYLGVQSKEKPIDSFHDLVAQQGFRWGVESRYMSGIALIFFQSSTDPDVQAVYRTMDYIEDVDQTFQKISKGKYAMITYGKLGRTLIDSYYTDKFGNTPFYVGKHGYGLVPYFGWGYRQGAPFRERFDNVINRLNEAGIIDFWTAKVMAGKVRENRKEIEEKGERKETNFQAVTDDSAAIQFGVIHTVGVFITVLLGYFISFITFVFEKISAKRSSKKRAKDEK